MPPGTKKEPVTERVSLSEQAYYTIRERILKGAIALLEKAPDTKRPKARHLRLWYALADLRERAGDVPGARELFERIVRSDPTLTDAPERLGSLGR